MLDLLRLRPEAARRSRSSSNSSIGLKVKDLEEKEDIGDARLMRRESIGSVLMMGNKLATLHGLNQLQIKWVIAIVC